MKLPSVANAASTLHRRWDDYDAYLFDIDGTLLHCADAVHYFAFCDALQFLSGRTLNLDGVVAHGNTDVGILRDALAIASIPEGMWRPRLAEALDRMGEFVTERRLDLRTSLLPSVPSVLQHLRGRDAMLGVATGNLRVIGELKLAAAGIAEFFHFGGYSDACETRRDVFCAALETARSLAGTEAAVCVLGDTPEDVRAARANGMNVVAVATGVFPFEQLAAEMPTLCCHTFADLMRP